MKSLFAYFKKETAASDEPVEDVVPVDESTTEAPAEETGDKEQADVDENAETAEVEAVEDGEEPAEKVEDQPEPEEEKAEVVDIAFAMNPQEVKDLAELAGDATFAHQALSEGMDFAAGQVALIEAQRAKIADLESAKEETAEQAEDAQAKLDAIAEAGELEPVSTEGNKPEAAAHQEPVDAFRASIKKQVARLN